MNERVPKIALIAAAVVCPLVLLLLAYSQPRYFANVTNMGGLILIEGLAVAVWMYRRFFFALVIVAFLFAGVRVAVGGYWTTGRWAILAVGAAVGSLVMLKERNHRFGLFHVTAVFAVLTSIVSASVSQFPGVAILKASSFGLLFLYAGTGARLAVTGRESRFFTGLLAACEGFVAVMAVYYLIFGIGFMGNPNSLGAVMGVAAAPMLFWGALLPEPLAVNRRRLILYLLSMYLTFHSHSRAGMAAALISCGLLCAALRKYTMIGAGVAIITICIAAGAIFNPDATERAFSSVTKTVLYKDSTNGNVFASREDPWQRALDTISNHFWFGTGLGTADVINDGPVEMFVSTEDITSENGSSYLAILAGVGILGVLPFFLLMFLLLGKIARTVLWMLTTGNACHPAVPIAMIMLAGLIHAAFEDWLFAAGYHLCVLFWCLAFVFMDVAPSGHAIEWRFGAILRPLGVVAPNR
ncbi:MAG TPA: O-antigen ligase family protein [Candidatus Sulfotelmatobacter sp.]